MFLVVVVEEDETGVTAAVTKLHLFYLTLNLQQLRYSFAVGDKREGHDASAHDVNEATTSRAAINFQQENHKDNPGVSCRLRVPPAFRFD